MGALPFGVYADSSSPPNIPASYMEPDDFIQDNFNRFGLFSAL